jgi:YD repeat-containing protein
MNVGPDRRLDPTTGHTSAQRKTTLKWDENGELTAVDMVRVIDRLTQPELARCDLDPS